MTTKYANLSDKQRIDIESRVLDLGIMILEDGREAVTISCEEVQCPICKKALTVYTSGKSYVISCEKDGVITSFRGFTNASYLLTTPTERSHH